MGKKHPHIDAYIARSAPFARPILANIRKVVHKACPKIVETVKWSSPFYDYKGLLIGTPAFKQHCAVVFWRDIRLGADRAKSESIKRRLRCITAASELPAAGVLLGYIRDAIRQRDHPAPRVKRVRKPAKSPTIPSDLKTALTKNAAAGENFRQISPSHRREYVEWITSAKRPETRARRIATAVKWLVEGKALNWKYARGARAAIS